MLSRMLLVGCSFILLWASPAPAADDRAAVRDVVDRMYREYVASLDQRTPDSKTDPRLAFVKSKPYFSKGFEQALEKLIADALRQEPEMGLDYDPIINGQDLPEKGFRTAAVTLKGDTAVASVGRVGRKSPPLKVRLIRQEGSWLIDGIDTLNAAPEKPASRKGAKK
jgi:Protein of unknown function (DUF3828)